MAAEGPPEQNTGTGGGVGGHRGRRRSSPREERSSCGGAEPSGGAASTGKLASGPVRCFRTSGRGYLPTTTEVIRATSAEDGPYFGGGHRAAGPSAVQSCGRAITWLVQMVQMLVRGSNGPRSPSARDGRIVFTTVIAGGNSCSPSHALSVEPSRSRWLITPNLRPTTNTCSNTAMTTGRDHGP